MNSNLNGSRSKAKEPTSSSLQRKTRPQNPMEWASVEEALKQNGLRVTRPRLVLFEILQQSQAGLSASDICEKMVDSVNSSIDPASVYRNLAVFHQMGLVHRLQSGKYIICHHSDESDHNHMHILGSCIECEKTYEIISPDEKFHQISDQFKKHLQFHSFTGLTLEGLCKNCQS